MPNNMMSYTYRVILSFALTLLIATSFFASPPLYSNDDSLHNNNRPQVLAESKFSDLAKQLGLGVNNSSEPLQPDEAFKYDLSVLDDNKLIAIWKIVPGHYLYRDKIVFTALSPEGVKLGEIKYAESKPKADPLFGEVQVYEKDFELSLPIGGAKGNINIQTEYQGCSELTGICYPPIKIKHTLSIDAESNDLISEGATATTKKDTPNTAVKTDPKPKSDTTKPDTAEPRNTSSETKVSQPATPTSVQTVIPTTGSTTASPSATTPNFELPVSEQESMLNTLNNSSKWLVLLIFLGSGILLAFTPCVYPMVPILSSIIVGHGKQTSTKKAFALSLAYVLPMAFIYGIAGYFIGLGGENLQVIFQKPWIIISFAVLFVLLALSMFGFYNLQMPQSIQNKLTSISNDQESGTLLGAVIMGTLSALIVGPCVTGPIMGAFTYIANEGSAFWGAVEMFLLGIGIGIPLLILGTSAGRLLPRAGAWMEATKAIFGVVLLGMAIWMLDRVVEPSTTMLLSGILLITSGVYMGALSQPAEGASRWHMLWKGLGLIAVIYGALMLAGASMGNRDLMQPLKQSFTVAQSQQGANVTFKKFKGLDGLKKEVEIAKQQNKPVLVDFYADWCTYCKTLEIEIFPHPKVAESLSGYILLKTDITAMDEKDTELLKHYGLLAPPILMFFANGEEQTKFRLYGEPTVDQLSKHASLFDSIY